MNPSLAQTQDVDYDAPHWNHSPESVFLRGSCETCVYGCDKFTRRGQRLCLFHSTARVNRIYLDGDSCYYWGGGKR